MPNEKILLSFPHMGGSEHKYVQEAFESNWIAPLGPNVDHFENQIMKLTGSQGVIAMSSGTAAIHIALRLLGIQPGDKVLVSSLTFIASVNPILYEGATPVFIDSEEQTWNLCPKSLELALQKMKAEDNLPKALIAVDILGMPCDYDKILDTCKNFGIPVVEDAAESVGSSYNGTMCGNFGEYAAFSFNGNKIITTGGGGCLLSSKPENKPQLKEALSLITQAKEDADHYLHTKVGFNYRMSNVLAGIGLGQLEVLSDRVAKRRAIFDFYKKGLSSETRISFQPEQEGYFSNRWLTSIHLGESLSGKAADLNQYLLERKIDSRRMWRPMHTQPLFEGSEYFSANTQSFSDELFKSSLCLPSATNYDIDNFNTVVDHVLEWCRKH